MVSTEQIEGDISRHYAKALQSKSCCDGDDRCDDSRAARLYPVDVLGRIPEGAVISNCVINLAPDKDAVFREAHRVLRPGGRLMVSDILLARPATEEEMQDMSLRSGCISGSLPAEEYAGKVRAAGFEDVRVSDQPELEDGTFWYSAGVSGRKA